jgi:hypothetical protein
MALVSRHRALILFVLGVSLFLGVARPAQELPQELQDEEFWRLIREFSEPDGNFHSDNFVSNERSFQHVLADLARDRQPGSAYIGVGPEQNYTYLLAVKPRIAFIVDIRRQNLVQHLMFKAIFEQSEDRAAFLSRLFSRRRPAGLRAGLPVGELFNAFRAAPPDAVLQQENLQAIKDLLIKRHGFALSPPDEHALEYVHVMFSSLGPSLTYDGQRLGLTGVMPTFEDLMRETDQEGNQRSFMASEENYQVIQQLHKKNLLVPIVGDFAGPNSISKSTTPPSRRSIRPMSSSICSWAVKATVSTGTSPPCHWNQGACSFED